MDGDDALYWEVNKTTLASLKHKWIQVDEETLDDSVSMIKMAPSTKKAIKAALKSSPSMEGSTPPFAMVSRYSHHILANHFPVQTHRTGFGNQSIPPSHAGLL